MSARAGRGVCFYMRVSACKKKKKMRVIQLWVHVCVCCQHVKHTLRACVCVWEPLGLRWFFFFFFFSARKSFIHVSLCVRACVCLCTSMCLAWGALTDCPCLHVQLNVTTSVSLNSKRSIHIPLTHLFPPSPFIPLLASPPLNLCLFPRLSHNFDAQRLTRRAAFSRLVRARLCVKEGF